MNKVGIGGATSTGALIHTPGHEGDPGKEGGGDGAGDHREGEGGVQGPGRGRGQEGLHQALLLHNLAGEPAKTTLSTCC